MNEFLETNQMTLNHPLPPSLSDFFSRIMGTLLCMLTAFFDVVDKLFQLLCFEFLSRATCSAQCKFSGEISNFVKISIFRASCCQYTPSPSSNHRPCNSWTNALIGPSLGGNKRIIVLIKLILKLYHSFPLSQRCPLSTDFWYFTLLITGSVV